MHSTGKTLFDIYSDYFPDELEDMTQDEIDHLKEIKM